MSALFFHGPTAKQAALDEATRWGELACPPFGDETLRVDDAREIVRLMHTPIVGTGKGVVVIGLGKAEPKTQDVLLKTLEEYDSDVWQVILWATDLSVIRETIRSRCLVRWTYSQTSLLSENNNLLEYLDEGKTAEIISLVRGWSDRLPELLDDTVLRMTQTHGDEKSPDRHAAYWQHLRPLYESKSFTQLEFVNALLGAMK